MHDLASLRAHWRGAHDTASAALLEQEIAKLGSLVGEEPAWRCVQEHAEGVLRGGPDLVAGVYLAQALLMIEGVAGLALGLGIVRDLLRDHWDELAPPLERLRARRSALVWLGERGARGLPASPDAADATRCAAALGEVIAECERRFAEPLLGALRRRLETVCAPRATNPPAEDPVAACAPAGSRAEAAAHLARAAEYFQRCEPHSPVGPLLRRALVWCELGFEEVFRELLARAPEARGALWETLGLKPEPKR